MSFLTITLIFMGLFIIIFHVIKKKDSYDSPEHVMLADGDTHANYKGIILTFPDKKVYSSDYKFNLTKYNIHLTFGQISAFSGDLFATLKPISDGATVQDREKLFMDSFNVLNNLQYIDTKGNVKDISKTEVLQIIDIINKGEDLINKSLDEGVDPSIAIDGQKDQDDVRYNIATGGGSKIGKFFIPISSGLDIINLKPEGRYMQLAEVNWDHFLLGGRSSTVYMTGHTLACKLAAEGGIKNNVSMLIQAYVLDAFACHYLGDSFAGGHIRTPRKELHYGDGTKDDLAWINGQTIVGDYLSRLMHGEDNAKGVYVSNKFCENSSDPNCSRWTAYGDHRLFDKEDKENLEIAKMALQKSVDEVWESYNNKKVVESVVLNYIPNINDPNLIPGGKK